MRLSYEGARIAFPNDHLDQMVMTSMEGQPA